MSFVYKELLGFYETYFFNGIIGFASDEENDNKLIFTGNVKFDLNNTFGIGENIRLHWLSATNHLVIRLNMKKENHSHNVSLMQASFVVCPKVFAGIIFFLL